jgi:MerR family transcriptional regulator, light-induced transcriptional regulator
MYMNDVELFPIRTVASITGMNPGTLRAWERRYGLIKPLRTETGRRMYTREHIDLVHRMHAMLESGMGIGEVSQSLQSSVHQEAPSVNTWVVWRKRMSSAVSRFDEPALERLYDDALATHPLDRVTSRLLLPLLAELGDRWESAEGSVAEEHFFATFLRNKIGARFHHRAALIAGPMLLGACAPGEHHEIGLMLFALAAHDAGIRSVLLGANTPLADLPLVCRRAECDAVVISSSVEPSPEFLREGLRSLVLRARRPVFVGGDSSVHHRDAIVSAGAIPLGTDIPLGVRRIAGELSPHKEKN